MNIAQRLRAENPDMFDKVMELKNNRTIVKEIKVMGRDIKFRGYSESGERWVYGFLTEYDIIKESVYPYYKYEVSPESVSQYIGVKDINGVDIYEGDVIAMTECDCAGNKTTYKGEIIFEGLEYRSKTIESTILREGSTMSLFPTYEFEVIGNTYEQQKTIKP